MEKIPVIIDTDPGVDDAIAIMLANSSDHIHILGLTPVDGNVRAKYTYQNALNLADFLGMDCVVAKGADKQLTVQCSGRAEDIHGKEGFGNVVLPKSRRSFSNLAAWDYIYEQAKKYSKKLVIAAIGPLTDIAIALQKYPDLKEHIDKLVIMGGGTEGGNRTPYAEFNFWMDPPAAKVVFESGLHIVMAGLNVTLQTGVPIDFIKKLSQKPSHIADVLSTMVDTYNDKALGKSGNEVSVVHDAIPMFYLMRPECCKTERCNITINAVAGDERWGQSVASYDDPCSFNTELITDINMDEYLKEYENMTEFYTKR